MESLKEDLLLSLRAVKVFQEGSETWLWHDGRIRYLLEYLYGDTTRREMSKEGGQGLQRPPKHRRSETK